MCPSDSRDDLWCTYPDDVSVVDVAGQVEGGSFFQLFQLDHEFVSLFVILIEGIARGKEHSAGFVFQYLRKILILHGEGDSRKFALLIVVADAIGRSYPQSVFGISENATDIVVGQPHGVVYAEVLVVLVAVILIETTEGANPDLSVLVLADAFYFLVGYLVRERPFFSLIGVLLVGSVVMLAG